MENKIAKVAVASAVFSFDKPFDYLAGPAFSDLQVGARVLVPFGQANKPTEGFVLALQETAEEAPGCKEILYLYRDGICLSKEEISLALWMRSRYFCSFFECANAMLPPGLVKKGWKPSRGVAPPKRPWMSRPEKSTLPAARATR